MSNTTVFKGTTVTIVPDGSTDWDWQSETEIPAELRAYGCFIRSIQFHPSAQNERLLVRDGSSTGVVFCDLYCPSITPADKIKPFKGDQVRKPFIGTADCTWTSSSKITIEID